MKHLLLFAFIGLSLTSCKKELEKLNTTPNEDIDGVIYVGGISELPSTYKIELGTYRSGVDTTESPINHEWSASALVDEGDDATFEWTLNDSKPVNYIGTTTKEWLSRQNKWRIVSTVFIYNYIFDNITNFKLTSRVKFKKSETQKVQSTDFEVIKKDIRNDYLRFDFGMTKDQVKSIAKKEYKTDYYLETLPNVGIVNKAHMFQPNDSFTYFEFENNKLKAITVYQTNIQHYGGFYGSILWYYYPFKYPDTKITFDQAKQRYVLSNSVTWNNAFLKFTLQEKEFQVSSTEKRTYIGLIHEKL
ncbi:hypothetical protein [Siphonobacter sp. SORGH_AS_1065]|uniref:hypothetical protein n=1 Tax=Siphonobacter sp. SORGH_AS_1065 TaxID=3041795 RepID=UPI00277EA123|nr:hypothetical protein [Siphonobacter sp. SORGH_AS_1065]MDQ1088613.1 hypothetical protein [Siphonobacter sp. SORGH_AS_1065]